MRVPLPARGRSQLLDHAVRRRVLFASLSATRLPFAASFSAAQTPGSSGAKAVRLLPRAADLEVPIHPVVRAFAMRLRARRWTLARQST